MNDITHKLNKLMEQIAQIPTQADRLEQARQRIGYLWPDGVPGYFSDRVEGLSHLLGLENRPTNKIDVLLLQLEGLLTIEEWNADPDMLRGEKQIQGASKGGNARSKWPQRADEMQKAVDAIHAKHPALSYEDIKRRANLDHGYPLSALKRYTSNPKK